MDPNISPADIAATAAVFSAAVHAMDDRKDTSPGSIMFDPIAPAVPMTATAADDIGEPYEPADAGEPPYMMGDSY